MNPDDISPVELAGMLSLLPTTHVLVTAARLGIEVGALRADAPLPLPDYDGGRYHRQSVLPEYTELQKRRWPPTGDRDLWIEHGPDGPPDVDLDHPFLKRLADAGLYPQKPEAAA